MRKLLMLCMMIAAFNFGFLGRNLLNVHAEEKSVAEKDLYYTSIQIQRGDSLWDIANRYAKDCGFTVKEYLKELKRMNGLQGEKIHSGEFLMVMYAAQ